jgi:hypothetical protein
VENKAKKIPFELSLDELRFLTSIMTWVNIGMFRDIDRSWYPVINELAQRLSLLDIRQSCLMDNAEFEKKHPAQDRFSNKPFEALKESDKK